MVNDNKTAHHIEIKVVFDGEVSFFYKRWPTISQN